ncbi:hypothetical protein [Leucobacter chromiireducens]|uniref:hypothetical protein n=1 Tax=Leucobacter chromiireducens TaxID=283877 RepID=UPI000F62F1EC|nr:hypothetical protein [Leucobacter chromiireducens]
MPSYGFKLLEIQLFKGKGRTALDFGKPGKLNSGQESPHYLDLLIDDFAPPAEQPDEQGSAPSPDEAPTTPDSSPVDSASADNERIVESVSIGSDDVVAEDPDSGVPEDEGQKQLAVVRVKSAVRFQGAVLLDTVYGIVGDHSLAVDPNGEQEDKDLTRLATTRHYRALVVAPAEGKNGLLAVEVVSRSHAGGRLPSRLHAGATEHGFKIRTFGALADEESVENLMKDGRIREVNLFQSLPSSDSSKSSTIPAKITFSIGAGSVEEETLKERLMPWLPTKKNKAKADEDKPKPAEEAASLASYLWPKIAETVELDAAEVVVDGKSRKRLKPLDMATGFTYDLGDVRPDDDNFVKQVAEVVNSLAEANQINLEDDWATRSDV